MTIRGTDPGERVDDTDERRSREEEEALVAFFEALRPEARRRYEELAARDRRWGEDVTRETQS